MFRIGASLIIFRPKHTFYQLSVSNHLFYVFYPSQISLFTHIFLSNHLPHYMCSHYHRRGSRAKRVPATVGRADTHDKQGYHHWHYQPATGGNLSPTPFPSLLHPFPANTPSPQPRTSMQPSSAALNAPSSSAYPIIMIEWKSLESSFESVRRRRTSTTLAVPGTPRGTVPPTWLPCVGEVNRE